MNHNPNPVHTFVFVSVSSSLPVMCPVTCTQRAELKSLDEHHRLLPNCAPCVHVCSRVRQRNTCVCLCVRLCIVLLSVCLVPCFHPMTLCTLFCLWTSKNVCPNKNRLTPHPAACFEQKKKVKTIWPPSHTFPAPVGSLEPHWHFCMTQNRPMFSKTVVHHQQMIKY